MSSDLPGPWTDHDAWVRYEIERHTGAAMVVLGSLGLGIGVAVAATGLYVTEVAGEAGATGFAIDAGPGTFTGPFGAALAATVALYGWRMLLDARASRRAARRRNLANAAVMATIASTILEVLRRAAAENGEPGGGSA